MDSGTAIQLIFVIGIGIACLMLLFGTIYLFIVLGFFKIFRGMSTELFGERKPRNGKWWIRK